MWFYFDRNKKWYDKKYDIRIYLALTGWNTSSVYLNQIYEYERNTGKVYTGRPTSWIGKIVLAYPSDYGYAAYLADCTQTLHYYDNSTCTLNNWMKNILSSFSSNYGRLLTSYSDDSGYVWAVNTTGDVHSTNGGAFYKYEIVPALFLNSKLGIESGTGTSTDPYQLLVN